MMNHKKWLLPSLAVLPVVLFSSCASSERMGRMSGTLQSYRKPAPDRIEHFIPAEQRRPGQFAGLNDNLINLWPFFYRGNDYCSIFWPMIDKDPYGFAVRPFYNQEGNEYSILFPFCAWNPVHRDGWIANAYWNKENSGMIPFFHHSRKPYQLSFYGPVWTRGKDYGFFPVARFSPSLNYAGPAWWNYENEKLKSGGFFPVARFSPSLNYAGPAWWNYENEKLKSGGFFPVARFSPSLNYAGPAWWNYENEKLKSGGFFPLLRLSEDSALQNIGPVWWFPGASCGLFPVARFSDRLSFAGPVWWERPRKTFGVFPMFCYRDAGNHFFLPLYFLSDHGKFFLSPIAAWDHDRMISILGPMYIARNETDTVAPGYNPMCSWREPRRKSSFRMYGLLAFQGNVTSYCWSEDVNLNDLRDFGTDAVRNPSFLRYQLNRLGYHGPLPENKAGMKKLRSDLIPFVRTRETDYYGLIPLFYYENSPKKTHLVSLLPYYSRTEESRNFSLFGGLLFRDYAEDQGKSCFSATLSPRSPEAVRTRDVLFLPLLTNFRKQEYYQESEALQAARRLHSMKYSAANRSAINAELRKLRETLQLPETVQDQEAYRDFLTRTVLERKLKTESFRQDGCLPLLIRDDGRESVTWISPALLSYLKRSKQDDSWSGGFLPLFLKEQRKESVTWISPALLSGVKISKNGHSFLSLPLMSCTESKREEKNSFLPLQSPNRVFDAVNPVSESWSAWLGGLYQTSEKEFFVAKNPAEENMIQTLRSGIQRRISLLRRQEQLENAKRQYTGKNQNRMERIAAGLSENSKMLKESEAVLKQTSRTLNLPQVPDLNSISSLESGRNALYAGKIRKRSVRSFGTWGFRYSRSEQDYQWDIAKVLAGGSGIGGVREAHVLRYLYFSRTEGEKSETLFFPFVSIQKDGADSRWSFFWRLLERREIQGKTSGHILFIPYGN